MLTLSEMSKRLGRSTKTFRKYVDQYQIPHIRMGNDFLFDEAEVVAYLKKYTEQNDRRPVLKAEPKPKVRVAGRGRFAEALGL